MYVSRIPSARNMTMTICGSIFIAEDEEDDFIVDEQGRPLRRRKGDGTYSEP